MEKISIIIPVFNEEKNIKSLVERIAKSLTSAKIEYEIIFVDDYSSDKTRSIIKSLQDKYPISLYFKKGKKGKAYSLLEGFSYAKYENLGMIDADLQYPPEALPEMLKKINDQTGLVVANRIKSNTSFIRRIISKLFLYPFVKILHGLDYDVQSGLKVFKKEIIERIKLNPGPWSFDLEFLLKAKQAGYGITSEDIVFEKRKNEIPKISIIPASFDIGLSALKLKFQDSDVIKFHPKHLEKKGKGFHFKGFEFIHHSLLENKDSAFIPVIKKQKIIILSIFLFFVLGLIFNWINTLKIFVAALTFVYFTDLFFNLFLIIRSFAKKPEIQISDEELEKNRKLKWPKYTVLCPLYKEWQILPQFVSAMSRLDYPKEKLQVLLLLEEDDKETIEHSLKFKLPSYFKVIIVPHSLPKTKPKALNYGLKYATGEYIVIYDAEDVPDRNQLKKAVLAFNKTDEKTICIQAKLNFYNPHQNVLTRVFTAEYSLWFDLVLTGLQSMSAPIPLGGTSNHFRIDNLKELKGWDSFNVTEDCDLGMRLVKNGYKTALINSLTLEEANPDLANWFNQRTRWIKGYIQTYLVHMRSPKELFKKWREPHLLTFQLIVGGKVLSMFINPFLWIITIGYFAFRSTFGVFIQQFFPAPVLYMGVFSLVFGNFLYMYYYMIAVAKRDNYDLVKYVYLVPFYWLMMSFAAWKALVQFITRPHFWPKTIHGYHFDSEKVMAQAAENIGKKLIDTRFITYPVNLAPAYTRQSQKAVEQTWSKKTVSSGTFLLAAMMISNFLNFLFNAYLGRVVSFENFGLITLINTFWYLASIFLSSLGSTINHRYAYLQAKEGSGSANFFFMKTFRKSLKISIIITIFWIILTPFLTSFFKVESLIPLLSFSVIILLAPVASVNTGLLHGSFSFYLVGILFITAAITKFASSYLFVALNLSSLAYLSIPLSIVFSFFAASITMYIKLNKEKIGEKLRYVFPKRFFTASIVSGLSTSAFLSIDVILAKHYLSPHQAGEYAFLSLVGKMIYYFGSILNVFMTPFVSRDIGANRNPNKSFYRIMTGTILMTVIMFLTIGVFGNKTIPFLFGEKAFPILPYLQNYSLAIGLFVIVNSIISYHLIRHHYSFPITALLMSLLMLIGIILNHRTIADFATVIQTTSFISLFTMIALHLLQRNGRFLFRNIIDLVGLFLPIPIIKPTESGKKRILVFNWRDIKHKFSGGAEVYIHELAKRWVKKGHEVTLFCGNDGNAQRNEMVDGVNVVRRGGFYFVYVWAILYYLLRFRNQYDIVIDSENGIPFFTPLFVNKEKIFLLIHHVHQEVFRKSLVPPLSWIAEFLEMKLMPFVYKNVRMITVSPSSKKDILEKQLTQVEPEIIYNGVDLKTYKPAEKSSVPLVLYVGRFKYYKSLDIFLHSAKKILEKLPEVKFVLAGDGEEKEGLVKLAKKLNIFEKISFLGRVSEEEKIKLYQKAWVFVNPSFMEGWGITTIEANACGTPVVASNVPGLRDSVDNPHSGFLVPYGNINIFSERIIKLIKDDSLKAKMSIEAIYWAQQFDWQKSADKSLRLFKNEK